MPTTLTPMIWAPVKGLNTSQSAHIVPMDMCSDGYDFVIEENSYVKKRDGFSYVNATAVSAAPTISSMASLYLSSGTKYELLGTSNGDVWSDQSGVVTAKVFSGLSTVYPLSYTQFLDNLIVLDGNSVPLTWTGAATGSITAAPSGAIYSETHLNKLFLAGFPSARSRLDYSATGDYNTFTGSGTDQVNVDQNNGQVITGIKSFARNELVVFKGFSMYKLSGYDKTSFNLVSITSNIGCISSKSIQVFKSSSQGGLMFFASRDGIYIYDGSTPKKISQYIQPLWDSLNKTRFSQICSCLDIEKGRYLLSVCVDANTTNTRMICIDMLHPFEDSNGLHFPISVWRVSAQSMNTEFVSSTNLQRIVFGDTVGIKKYFGTLYSDNGATIETYITTPLMTFGDGIGVDNCLRRIYSVFVTSSGSIDIATEIKDGSDWIIQETILLSPGAAQLGVDFQIGISPIGIPEVSGSFRTNVSARSKRIKVRFLQDSSTRYFNLQFPVEFYSKTGGYRA